MTNTAKVKKMLFDIRKTERMIRIALRNILALRNYIAQRLSIQFQVDMAQGQRAFWHMTQMKLFILDGIHDLFQLYVIVKDRYVDYLRTEVNNISYYDWSSVLKICHDLDFIDEMNDILVELELDSDLWTSGALH